MMQQDLQPVYRAFLEGARGYLDCGGQIPSGIEIGVITRGSSPADRWPQIRQTLEQTMRAAGYETDAVEGRVPGDGRVEFVLYGFRRVA